jgi:hypothetical protein
MPTENDKQKFARKACNDFCSRTTILVIPGGKLTTVGSAVLMQTARGVPFLITAKHLVEDADWKPLRMFVPALDLDAPDVGEEAILAPLPVGRDAGKPVDVAVVTLRHDLHARLRPLAAGIDAVASDDHTEPEDVVILAGFPTFLSFQAPADARKYLFSSMTHLTGVTGKDEHGRLMIEWTEAVPHEDAPAYPHLDVKPGETMQLGSPVGISGGAVWRVRGASSGVMWSPSSHAKLIGVPVAWNRKDTEYAESVAAWGPWLAEVAARLNTAELDQRSPLSI